ncbi:AAA family ATPase [Calidithermus chliarophilus]|uniref:AAA family ATPase n=1 Tax=Calidithermus chliarophilus TaxID=52023 RepID=UPI0003F89038|nr:AAA family ATPase [Calidithermus chliarophilus]
MSGFAWKTADTLPTASEVGWLWEGYIAAGTVGILGGPAGAGKSTLIAALEVAVAAGVDFLEAPTQQGEVWHLDYDTDARLQGPWYRKVAAGLGVGAEALQRIHYLEPSNPSQGLDLERLDELEGLARLDAPRLIVIDAWTSAFFYADSKKAEHVAEVMNRLRQIAALGPAVLVLDHTPKPVQGLTVLERGVAGSFYKLGGARSAYLLQRVAPKLTGGQDVLRLDCLKNNLGPMGEPLGIARHFERDSLRFEITDLPEEEASHAPALTRALRGVREVLGEGPLLRGELIRKVAERANASERTITEALRRLKAAGEVEARESSGKGSPTLYTLRFAVNGEKADEQRTDLAQTPLRTPAQFALNPPEPAPTPDLEAEPEGWEVEV